MQRLNPFDLITKAKNNKSDLIQSSQLVKEIGSGDFGKIYRGLFSSSDAISQPVAIKCTYKSIDEETDAEIDTMTFEEFEDERIKLKILSDQKVPYVIAYLGYHANNDLNECAIIMELGLISAFDFIDDKLSMSVILNILFQIIEALHHMHALGFIHRDLKPANIMVCDNTNDVLVKLIDMGLATTVDVSGKAVTVENGNEIPDYRVRGNIVFLGPESIARHTTALSYIEAEFLITEKILGGSCQYKMVTSDFFKNLGLKVTPEETRNSVKGDIFSFSQVAAIFSSFRNTSERESFENEDELLEKIVRLGQGACLEKAGSSFPKELCSLVIDEAANIDPDQRPSAEAISNEMFRYLSKHSLLSKHSINDRIGSAQVCEKKDRLSFS